MKTSTLCATAGILAFTLWSTDSLAMGKKKQDPANEPVALQAKPFRYVNLAHVTTPTFFFPNGIRADFNADLDQLIDTQINSSKYFRTQLATPETAPRLIITGGITTLEMDVLQLNLKIGWNPSGPIAIGIPPVVNGEVDVRLSALSMDFKIYDRITGQTYLASYTDQTLSNIKFTTKVNLSNIQGSLDVLYKTRVADAIRTATDDIMKNMERSKNFDLLPWEAKIAGTDKEKGKVIINVGSRAGVLQNQVYSVYSHCTPEQQQAGCFERFLSDVQIDNAGVQSAEAHPFTAQDTIQSVYSGDSVFVKQMGK